MKPHLFILYFIISAGLAVVASGPVPGVISTVAGNGTPGSGGDGGPATSAQLNKIRGMAVDPADNLYIADEEANTIRKVTPDGVISTVASGLANPSDVAVDATGNLYIADFNHRRVVKVTSGGAISIMAADIGFPTAIAVDLAGNVYVADLPLISSGSGFVHKINPNGTVSIAGYPPSRPTGLAIDSAGNLYIADLWGVFKVDRQGKMTGVPGCDAIMFPGDVAIDSAGNLFIIDGWNDLIYMVTPSETASLVAGNGIAGFSGDGGPATLAQLNGLSSVAIDRAGNLLIGDSGNRRIRKVTWGGGSETFFPHVAVGGGYHTTFMLCNTGDSPISGDLILTDQQGQPLITNGSDVGPGSSFSVSIPPAGTMFLTVNPLAPNDPVKCGWARVTTAGGATAGGVLNGIATFHLLSGESLQAIAGVLPSQPTQYATILVDDDYSQGRLTAYALANPTSRNLVIKLALVDQDGRVVDDTVTVTLAPKQQIARYLYQDLARPQFKGSVVLRAQEGGSFVAVALAQHQKLFTVIPVIPGKAPSVPN